MGPARTVRSPPAPAATHSDPVHDRTIDTMLDYADEVMAKFALDFPKGDISPRRAKVIEDLLRQKSATWPRGGADRGVRAFSAGLCAPFCACVLFMSSTLRDDILEL